MRYAYTFLMVFVFCAAHTVLKAQSVLDSLPLDAERFAGHIQEHLGNVEQKFNDRISKIQAKIRQQESKLIRTITKTDSGIVSLLSATESLGSLGRNYIPLLDSLGTSFSFLTEVGKLDGGKLGELKGAISKVSSSLSAGEQFHTEMLGRLAMIKERLMSEGKVKELKKLQEQLFYYKSELESFRNVLDQPDQLISKSLQLLQQVPQFRKFFARHSQLSSMFMLPGDPAMDDPLLNSGLQTVAGVTNLLQQRFGLTGATLQSQVQSPSPSVEQMAGQLKNKLSFKNGQSGLDDMPNFKPDPVKTRTFLQRLEFGSNLQTQRAGVFPATMDIALTAAYRAGKRNSIGMGISYKLGLGEMLKDIRLSHQGLGLRSFIDFQWKGNLYLTGGFEMNYRQQINNMADLKDHSAWQQSGLVGLTRMFKAGNKLNARVQLLWDFLSSQQVPRSQPFVFRFGYSFTK